MTRDEPLVRAALWAPAVAALGMQLALAAPQVQAGDPAGAQAPDAGIVATASAEARRAEIEVGRQEAQREAQAFGKKVRTAQAAGNKRDAARAKKLSALAGIVADGKALPRKKRTAIADAGADFAKHVEYLDQRPIMPAGCEVMALTVTMRALGYDVDPLAIADRYLPGGSGEEAYFGSPYDSGGGLPPSIARAANAWLADHADGALGGTPLADGSRAHDLTGTPFAGVCALVEAGFPVLVWTTEDMAEPWVGASWYDPEHCVAMYGEAGDDVLVSDSLAGLVKRDRAAFERIYDLCGKRAVAILPR